MGIVSQIGAAIGDAMQCRRKKQKVVFIRLNEIALRLKLECRVVKALHRRVGRTDGRRTLGINKVGP